MQPEDPLGQQRQDRALLTEHPADQGVDRDQQAELREVRPQTESHRAATGKPGLRGSRGRALERLLTVVDGLGAHCHPSRQAMA